jgi:general secretion pathway protein J
MPTANTTVIGKKFQQGFTLLELLIASIIFAIMALMAYGGLDNVISNSQSSKQALMRLQQIQHTVSVLNRDLTQIIKRDIRDEYGNRLAYLSTADNIDNLVEFTRGGRVNPANLLRSSLLRIAYRFEEEKLIRLQWPQVDRAPGAEARQSVLLDEVEEVSIRFLDQNAEWQDQWPPLDAGGSPPELLAIEIIVQMKDWGDIRRLYAMN